MNPAYKEALSRQIENNFSDLEARIMSDIVRRIRKTGGITSTADYQINRLVEMGHSSDEIEKAIKDTLGASYPDMFELYDKVIEQEYTRNRNIYEQVNSNFVPYEKNDQMQQAVRAIIDQANSDMENITKSLGFCLDYGNGKTVFTPLSQVYTKYLDNAMMDIVTGTFDYNSVLRRVVTEMTNSGMRSIDYASGYTSRVNVAARKAVMTGVSNLTGKITEYNADKLGTDHYEVAWHAGARPTHALWQGRVWSMKQLHSVCGLGTPGGLLGINCYHEYYPFVVGISKRQYSDDWIREQNAKENDPKTFRGKTYTVYEAKQQQRKMETAMRAQRQKVNLLQEGNADPDDVLTAKCKYQAQLQEYGDFSKKMDLKQERDRIYLDMQGRVAPSKETYKAFIAKQEENAIIKAELKDAGLRGSINLKPKKIDMSKLSFDDEHINSQRSHGVTFEEARSIIQNASFSETVWKGQYERYYSSEGMAYVDLGTLKIRTAYKGDQVIGSTKKAIEVMKKYGR